jgi:hypothetical protein
MCARMLSTSEGPEAHLAVGLVGFVGQELLGAAAAAPVPGGGGLA